MKKLLMSLALLGTFAAMSAKGAESYIYWMVDPTDNSLQFNSAELYAFYGDAKQELLGVSLANGGVTKRNLATGAQETEEGDGILTGYNLASISAYPDMSFLVELYNDDTWVSQSTLTFDQAFKMGGIYEALAPAGAGTVTFTSFAVPEPTSGLLMLFGLCGLALKRKRA